VDPFGAAIGQRFLVAVPFLFEDVPVGGVGLLDSVAHPFEAEDLLVLEGLGRDVARGLHDVSSVATNLGFVPPPLFDRMLAAELSLLHRKRGGVEVLLVEMDPAAMRQELALEILDRGGHRLAICRREAGTLAIYKRDSNAVAATSTIAAALATLVATGSVRATGWISVVGDGLPTLSPGVVLRLAGFALDQSRASPVRRIERLELGHKATPAGLPDVLAATAP
jgi:hypothetical protein